MTKARGDGGGKPRGATGLPSLRFHHSEELRTRTLAVPDALEAAEDATTERGDLADVVLDLTEAGLDYYFIKPVVAAKAGFMAQQSTKLGISAMLKVMGPVTRRVLGGMNADQLLVVGQHIRHLMK